MTSETEVYMDIAGYLSAIAEESDAISTELSQLNRNLEKLIEILVKNESNKETAK